MTATRPRSPESGDATNPLLVRYLAGMGAADAVDDLASETWLRVVRGLPAFSGDEAGFRGWIVTIARNLLTDHRRRAQRRPETLVPEPPEPVAAGEDETVSGTLQRLGTEQAVRLVATLPADQAEMVLLRVVVGMDVAQVARAGRPQPRDRASSGTPCAAPAGRPAPPAPAGDPADLGGSDPGSAAGGARPQAGPSCNAPDGDHVERSR